MTNSARFFIISLTALFLSGVAIAPRAQALDIEVLEPRQDGCFIRLSGPIEHGDADRFHNALREYFAAYPPQRQDLTGENYYLALEQELPLYPDRLLICLDSQGGSLTEALRMAQLLFDSATFPLAPDGIEHAEEWNGSIGTRVGPNAECSSACAILFLAGGRQFFVGHPRRDVDRSIHPDALLGFHTPGLDVPNGTYTQHEVELAFSAAMSSMADLADLSTTLRMAPSLLRAMLGAGTTGMEYADTVGEISRWGIPLYAYRGIAELNDMHLSAACETAGTFLDGRDLGFYNTGQTWPVQFSEFLPRFDPPAGIPERRSVEYHQTEYGAWGASSGYIGFRRDFCEWTFSEDLVPASVRLTPLDEMWQDIQPWHYYPRGLPISALSPRRGAWVAPDEILHTFAATEERPCVEVRNLVVTGIRTCAITVEWDITGALEVTRRWNHIQTTDTDAMPGPTITHLYDTPTETPGALNDPEGLVPDGFNQCIFDAQGQNGYCRASM